MVLIDTVGGHLDGNLVACAQYVVQTETDGQLTVTRHCVVAITVICQIAQDFGITVVISQRNHLSTLRHTTRCAASHESSLVFGMIDERIGGVNTVGFKREYVAVGSLDWVDSCEERILTTLVGVIERSTRR